MRSPKMWFSMRTWLTIFHSNISKISFTCFLQVTVLMHGMKIEALTPISSQLTVISSPSGERSCKLRTIHWPLKSELYDDGISGRQVHVRTLT